MEPHDRVRGAFPVYPVGGALDKQHVMQVLPARCEADPPAIRHRIKEKEKRLGPGIRKLWEIIKCTVACHM